MNCATGCCTITYPPIDGGGYKLENGELLIAEDEAEAEVIRISYDKYVNTTMRRALR